MRYFTLAIADHTCNNVNIFPNLGEIGTYDVLPRSSGVDALMRKIAAITESPTRQFAFDPRNQ
jgi:hypothetical protein